MNWDQIKCNWKQVSDKIKLTWGKLSEDDLAAIAGQRDLLCQPAPATVWVRESAGGDEGRRLCAGVELDRRDSPLPDTFTSRSISCQQHPQKFPGNRRAR